MRSLATVLILTSTLWVVAPIAYSQAFPIKPLNIVVPIGPGGGYDFTGRLLGEGLSKELGQSVVVENRPGAGTVVGTQYVVKSAPDGYTMVIGGIGSIAHASALVKDLPYNPGTDLVPLQLVSTNSYTLSARADFGPKNLQELIAYARANPGKLSFGTGNRTDGGHFAAEKPCQCRYPGSAIQKRATRLSGHDGGPSGFVFRCHRHRAAFHKKRQSARHRHLGQRARFHPARCSNREGVRRAGDGAGELDWPVRTGCDAATDRAAPASGDQRGRRHPRIQ